MLSVIQKTNKDALAQLPKTRKIAGNKAHIATYQKLIKYSAPTPLFKFLGISHPCAVQTKNQLFFEVRLGNRIADCIMLTSCGETRICYVIELKTCMTSSLDLSSDIRQTQRSQGLCQLADTVSFIQNYAPPGRQAWTVLPILIFKSQATLKTLHVEIPKFPANLTHTSEEKLSCFFFSRSDVEIRKKLHFCSKTKTNTQWDSVLDPTSTKQSVYRQRIIDRNKKKCFSIQVSSFKCRNRPNKKINGKLRTGQADARPFEKKQHNNKRLGNNRKHGRQATRYQANAPLFSATLISNNPAHALKR
ncbi:fusion protein [Ateline gammaherpesvirus 3]|uniref:Fusion protein n=1 Tax=Ateline herpesvirus 3 TaxID=85618 RepID=Q9YTP6_ATHV3|nr:fusion protein [Ateline gammaherpesvirus 3]AAC95544.1 fusion protein [Ateline gammaherpesvirus 3]